MSESHELTNLFLHNTLKANRTTQTRNMVSFNIENSTALVTGTNKKNGIGRAIVKALAEQGASKIYATARQTHELDDLVRLYPNGKVVAVALDVTDHTAIATLPTKYPDVNLVVNNAGYFAVMNGSLGNIELARKEIEINYLAPMAMGRAYGTHWQKQNLSKSSDDHHAPTAIVNVNAITSYVNVPFGGTYSASKAASHSLTQAQRRDLWQNTLVIGVYPGPTETDMTKQIPLEKASVENVASSIITALKGGTEEIFPDGRSNKLYHAWKSDAKNAEMMQIQAACAPKTKPVAAEQ